MSDGSKQVQLNFDDLRLRAGGEGEFGRRVRKKNGDGRGHTDDLQLS
jgi:hypothetical protein